MYNSRRFQAAVLSLLLLFWLFVAWSIPYGPIDDFQWGMEDGLRWWLGGLLNGRYAGNMFAVIMCRFPLAKTLIMGLSMFLIPTLAARIAVPEEQFFPALLLCHTGILLMPSLMWRETYGWVSGFVTNGISTFLFLVWLILLRRTEQSGKLSGQLSAPNRAVQKTAWATLLFLLCLTLGMFVENLTLLMVGASLILSLYSLWDRELRLPFFACLLGASLALIPMFFNSVVAELFANGIAFQGIRELSFTPGDGPAAILRDILKWYATKLLPISFIRVTNFSVLFTVIIALGFWTGPLRPMSLLAVLPLAYHSYLLRTEDFENGFGVIIWLLPVLALAVRREDWPTRWSRLLLYLSAPLCLLPYAATTTRGYRLFLLPMVILLMTAVSLCVPLFRRRAAVYLVGAVLAGLMVLWTGRCVELLECTNVRAQLIQETIDSGADTLILPSDTQAGTTSYVRSPYDVTGAFYFRQFFHLSQDVTLVILPAGSLEDWPDIPSETWDARLELAPSDNISHLLP